MVLIIIYAQVLLMCARGAEPKIVYSRPLRNDTEMTVQPTEADDDETTGTNTTTEVLATLASTGHRYADSSKSMSSRNNHYYGVQYYVPPVVHGTAVADAFGRQLHVQQQHHLQRHAMQQPAVTAAAYHQRDGNRTPWEQTATVVHADGGPILMNPLQLQPVYDDSSTAQYTPPKPHRTQPVARIIKYTEPASAAVAYQLPYLAAEADDRTLLDNLPALQFALHHATGKTPPPPLVSTSGHQQYAALQQPPNLHHHLRHHPVKQTPATAMHQVYPQHKPYAHLHRNHQRVLQLHPGHQGHLPHRYASYGAAQPATRYTQVPFVYNLPAPPTAQRHLLAPAEYDLVSRFNRLIKQREQDDRQRVQESARRRRPEDVDGVSGDASVGSDSDDGEEEETATRPAVKVKKSKKKKKKKKKKPAATAPPAPVEEEIDEEDGDRQLSPSRRHKQLVQQDDEQPNTEEQESQNVHTSEQLPEGTIVQETEDELQHTLDGPSQLSEQFGGDLTFEDGGGERVEFQLHGIGGPDSYKFGFDTGKGSNRQFRYEERDNGGNVHGHYGYLDNDGKMQVYNYSAHPELGYRAQKAETLEV
ncbi:RNA-binding protein 33-like [Melanaphis sacchari]|uniref:RNA-binding protein 33-like n=1 Tax=Melanaphis sacchari TaxID=742174 RepID=UPI000DC14824|nr:RNA-binding protein 33-like [Melanaphis sacchari]